MSSVSSTSSSSLASSLAISGLASGMDWQTVVSELAAAERSAETPWATQQTTLNNQNTAFTSIKDYLTTLQTDVKTLQNSSLWQSAASTSSDTSVATASVAS